MADFFEIEYLKKSHDYGIYKAYLYLNINHLEYWRYEANDPVFGKVYWYRLPGVSIPVSKEFHIKFKEALKELGHTIKYF